MRLFVVRAAFLSLIFSAAASASTSAGTLGLSATAYTVSESGGTVVITVDRTGGASGAVSVFYTTVAGTATSSDYSSKNGRLYWTDGDSSPKTFSVSILNSDAINGTKQFSVDIKDVYGGAALATQAATVTIAGSGGAGTLELSSSTFSVSQSAGSLTVAVDRTAGSAGTVSVFYATATASATAGDFSMTNGRLTWTDGDMSPKTFAVPISNAVPFVGTKQFSITIKDVRGAAKLSTPTTSTATITGDAESGGAGPAAKLAAKLGTASRLLIGLGEQDSVDPIAAIQSQGLKVDIYTRYLGSGDWTSWNSPPCDYVCVVATAAAAVGAIPMYTQYQMANDGDGNISVIGDASFMTTYWARIKLLYQDIAASGKPALVNLEPDFWGYAEQHSPNGDPTQLAAVVSANPDCATLGNNVKGVAQCMIAMARKYAPKAFVGFPFSTWGGNTDADVIAFMNAVGSQNADFLVEETLDRDAGCFEVSPQPSYCSRSGSGWYWDATNKTHPNFQDHLTQAEAYHTGIGNLPLIWWQTPEGVPSATPGGTDYHYRDNRENYFLTYPAQLTAVGGLGVVFSTGEGHQTNITTDNGQFQLLDSRYFSNPAPLP